MRRRCVVGLLALSTLVLGANSASAQGAGRITGRVTDETGRPLEAVQVVVQETRQGALTRADGQYTITGVATGQYQVQASRTGYATRTQAIPVVAGQVATVNFSLAAQAVQLEQLVAVGYGTQRRRDLTGAIASVSGEEIATRAAPTTAVVNAIQGKAPGVQVVTNSGIPGGGASVRIRGTNSIGANSEPLYVVDGLPVAQGTRLTDPTQNPLSTINPNDVESIEILKDASATAIYGARGANGVVLITTKRGRRGEDRLTLESSYGVQEISKTIDVLNAQQYRELRNEALRNVGQEPRYSEVNVPTYNYSEMLLRTAPQQTHTLTFSGGDSKTRYLVSGNLMDQDGIIVGTGFRRYAGRLNLDREFGSRFRVGSSLSLARTRSDLSQVENGELAGNARGILNAMMYDPALPVRDENGQYIRRAQLGEFIANPVATVNELIEQRNDTRFIGNVYAELELTEELRLRSSVGGNVWDAFNPYFAPSSIYQGFQYNGEARIWQGRSDEVLTENLLNYTREELGPGRLEATAGFSVQTNRYEYTNMRGRNFQVQQPRWNNLGSGADRPSIESGSSEWALLSYLGRVNYNLLDRYLFTVTARRDGSSRFGANNKWAFFPSAAFAWRVADEPFLRDQSLFSDLKLRLSYGVTGNQGVDPYQSLAQLASASTGVGGVLQTGYAPASAAPNPDLKWETTRQFNAGADLGFLDNRLTLSADAYHSRTEDLLLTVNMPFTSGFATQLRNIGAVKNTGVELALNTVNIENARFTWRSSLNLARNRNEVVNIDARDYIETGQDRWGWATGGASHLIKPGEPLGSIYGYKVQGLWQAGQTCDVKEPRPTLDCVPGELHIQDVNGDGKISPDDRTIIGSAEPDFYGGFTNNLSYGPLTLDVFFNFSVGNDVVNASNAFLMSATGQLNERAEVLDRWTPTNTNTSIPRANANRRTLLYSTLIEDGSFLRLQSLTLGYQLPTRWLRGAEAARLFVTGQNLWILTDYSGFDPEVNSLGGDPAARGLDVGAYPRARAWNFGVNVTF